MEEQDFDFNLLIRFIEGKATTPEKQLVQEWIGSDAQHKQLYFQVKDILDYEQAQQVTAAQTAARWQQVEAVLNNRTGTGKTMHSWYRVAAAVAVMILLSATLLYFRYTRRPEMVTLFNKAAAPMQVSLPDNSQVWLLNGSELSYRREWKNDRKITLKGTAYFEVSKQTGHPFTVTMQQMEIIVLGTSFIANSNSTTASAAVSDGMVKAVLPGQEWILKPNEGVFYENGKSRKSLVHSNYYRMMKDGYFEFDNTNIREIGEIIKVVYGYNVEIRQPESLSQNSISGRIAISSEEDLRKVIAIMMHVEIIKNGQQIIIQPK